MNEKEYMYFVQEISDLFKDNAKKAKIEADNPKEGDSLDYNTGFLMAYHEVIAIMKNQAPFFHLKQEDIRLEDIEPERDLI